MPHQVLGNPIAFEEGIGVAMYFAPLIVVYTVSAILTGKDRWIGYILHTFLILALLDAGILLVEFKHIGADIYTFRYTSPSIGLGLVCGSMAGDLVASYFFLPARQSFHVASLPQALVSWIIYGCVLYKDQLWRLARRGLRVEN